MEKENFHTPEENVDDTTSLPDEESAFYIEEEDRVDKNDLLKDPTDFTDTVNTEKNRRSTRIWAIILGVFAAVVIVLGLIIVNFMNNKNDVPAPSPTPVTTTTTKAPDTKDPGVVVNPLLEGYKTAPKVTAGEQLVQVTDASTVSSGKNNIVFTAPQQVKPSNTPCKVTQPTDFCLAARGTSGEKTFDLYYLKDAAHSRLFENPSTFKKLTVKNSPSAGILPLQMGSAKLPTAVILNTDSSGWMIVTQETDPAAVEAFVKTVTVN